MPVTDASGAVAPGTAAGEAPGRLAASRLNVEGIAYDAARGTLLLFSDDGTRAVDGAECKRIPDATRRYKQYPHEMSGGLRQRAMIAMALSCRPALLIADEPTTALDVTIQAQILALLDELKGRLGMGLLLITHDLSVVRHVSDSVVVMYLGKVVELAETKDLFQHPLHPYTHLLREASPIPDPALRKAAVKLEGEVASAVNPPSGCYFHPRCQHCMDICRKEYPA